MKEIPIMDVGGFRIGQAQNQEAATGCTVLICDEMSPAGVDVRGGGPASRETQILSPVAHADAINAILLSGGSAFGLDAAGGVQKYLEEQGMGFDVGVAKVPLVCQSCIFDLGVGRADLRPDGAMAYEACQNASYAAPEEGNVGVGIGCSVGKLRGMERAMKAGFGTYALQVGPIKVGALVAVNALGDIYEGETQIAGLLNKERTALSSSIRELLEDVDNITLPGGNTTLGIVVTNAAMTKSQLTKVAGMSHNGYARAIRPVHTMADGDSIYALSTGTVPADVNLIGILGALVMEKAIIRAVKQSQSGWGLPGFLEN
jgi:L-aminopeptidase/D-esterase-like protein